MIMGNNVLVDENFNFFAEAGETAIHFTDMFTFGFCDRDNNGPLKAITRSLVTDFNIWSNAIPKDDLEKFTTDCFYKITGETLYPIMLWSKLAVIQQGEKAVNASVRLTEMCGEKEDRKTSIILPSKQPYNTCKRNCEKLGGTLPLFRNQDDLIGLNDTISRHNRKDKDGQDRLMSQCGNEIWMPIIQGEKIQGTEDEYEWLEDVLNDTSATSFLPWELSQPNGQDLQKCIDLSLTTNQYTDMACDRDFCCVCQFSGEVNFHLHGIPETRDVDTHYIFVPGVQKPDELVFTGYKRNRITWKSKENKWFLLDRSDLTNPIGYHNITQEKVLVGLHDWNLYPDTNSITKAEEKNPLKFSKVLQY